VDALADLGVEHVELPATPERVWNAIRAARRHAWSNPGHAGRMGPQVRRPDVPVI